MRKGRGGKERGRKEREGEGRAEKGKGGEGKDEEGRGGRGQGEVNPQKILYPPLHSNECTVKQF
jgi:hypothetical protein